MTVLRLKIFLTVSHNLRQTFSDTYLRSKSEELYSKNSRTNETNLHYFRLEIFTNLFTEGNYFYVTSVQFRYISQ